MADSATCENILSKPIEDSDRADTADVAISLGARDPSRPPPTITPVLDPEVESECNQTLVAMVAFLRNSCKIVIAQKNRLLAQKDEDFVRCKAILAQKNDVLAALEARLAAACRTVTTITTERDEVVARAATVAEELKRTRAEYDDRIASLTVRVADAEANAAALQTTDQQQKTQVSEILLKNDDLTVDLSRVHDRYESQLESYKMRERNGARTIVQQDVEIAKLTKRLEAASPQRAAPASSRYSFHSFMFPQSGESESDSSFDSVKPLPPRWQWFTTRHAQVWHAPSLVL